MIQVESLFSFSQLTTPIFTTHLPKVLKAELSIFYEIFIASYANAYGENKNNKDSSFTKIHFTLPN